MCSGLNGWDTIGEPEQTIIGKTHGEPNLPKNCNWGLGAATIGVEQHTFRTIVFGFECVGHHWKTKNNHHWQHTWRTQFPKKKTIIGGLGRRRLGLSDTLFVLLCSGLNGWDTIGKQRTTIIGNMHGEPNFRKDYHWGLGWRRLGLSNTLFVLLCSGLNGRDTIGGPKQTIIGNTHGETNFRKKTIIGGWVWRRLGLSNTCF
jgi:hypothetical protein